MNDGRSLPAEIGPAGSRSDFEDLLARVGAERGSLDDKLLRHGALLFRGYDVRTAAQLAEFARAFSAGGALFGYAGGASPRKGLGEAGVYSSTEYPPDMTLSLHNELSYTDAYPSRLFFLCQIAAETGGETTLGDSRRILRAIDAHLVDEFRARGVRYIRTLSPHKGHGYSWQEAFESDDPAEAERSCRRIGAHFEWLDGGSLRISQSRPATAVHPVTGEEVWFNQADGFHPSALTPQAYQAQIDYAGSEDGFRLNVSYGDGAPIDRAALDGIRAALAAETVPHPWREGDILVLDNLLAAHGRRPFTGPRRIALAMS